MRQILVLQTKGFEPLNDLVIELERQLPDARVEVVDLTVGNPDYAALVDRIFASDSVQVW